MKKISIAGTYRALLLVLMTSPFFLFAGDARAADPVGHWRFDEGSGTTVLDSSGNGHHGTTTGATYSTTTPPNIDFENSYSLDFDGVDDGVETPLSVDGFGQFTIAGWAYPRTAAASEGWFGANDAFEFLFDDSTTLRCWTSVGAVNWSFASVENFLNNWHHITCLGDGDSILLYVDGVAVASTTHEHVDSYGDGDNFSMGLGVSSPGGGPFDGLIDDVRVYDVALTPQEMASLNDGDEEPIDRPLAVSFSPENGGVNVSTSTRLWVFFDEDVEWAFEDENAARVYKAEDDSLFFAQSGGGGSGTNAMSLAFPMPFEYGTEYYVIIEPDAIRDLDGNGFAGVTSSSTWRFTTRSEPEEFEDVEIPEDSIYEMLEQAFGEFDNTWTSVSASADGSRIVAVGMGFVDEAQTGFIYTSTDGGETWELATSTPGTLYSSVHSSSDGMSIATFGAYVGEGWESIYYFINKSTDGGETWDAYLVRELPLEELDEYDELTRMLILYLDYLAGSNDQSNMYLTFYDRIMHSRDGGETWETTVEFNDLFESVVFPFSISASGDGSKILVSLNSLMGGEPSGSAAIFSDDYGQSWEVAASGTSGIFPYSTAISKDGERLFITDAMNANMYISSNDGASWATSTNPDGYQWIYIAPSASGEGIVAAALHNTTDEHEDEGYWYEIALYSSRDNGATWVQQAVSEERNAGGNILEIFSKQLFGAISGSYDLSRLGLAAYSQLYVITQETPTLPEVDNEDAGRGRKRSGSSVRYGCKDAAALNYSRFVSHRQSLCTYAAPIVASGVPIPTSPASAALVRDLKLGMTGDDVLALQKLLNTNGFPVAMTGAGSPGNETAYFGLLTQAALAQYQKANSIVPALGYFGPLTRAHMKAAGIAGLWW